MASLTDSKPRSISNGISACLPPADQRLICFFPVVSFLCRILCAFAKYRAAQADKVFSVVDEASKVEGAIGFPDLASAEGQLFMSKACVSVRQKLVQMSRLNPTYHLTASRNFSTFVMSTAIAFEQLSNSFSSSEHDVTADHAKFRSLVANLEKGGKEQLIMDAHVHAGTEDHHEHVSRSQEVASKLRARFGSLEEDLVTKTSAKHVGGAEDGFVNIVSCGLREQVLDTHLASLGSFLRSIIIEQGKQVADLRRCSAAAEKRLAGSLISFEVDVGAANERAMSQAANANEARKQALQYKKQRVHVKEYHS